MSNTIEVVNSQIILITLSTPATYNPLSATSQPLQYFYILIVQSFKLVILTTFVMAIMPSLNTIEL